MVTKVENLYYTFCQSVGHDDTNFCAYDFLQERTYDSYFMKREEPQTMQEPPQVSQPVVQVPYTPPPPLQFVPTQPQLQFVAQSQSAPQSQIVVQPQYNQPQAGQYVQQQLPQ